MAQINFNDKKQEILIAIKTKVIEKNLIIPDPQGFTLIEGFINIPLQNELGSGNLMIGGPVIPAVGIVGNSSGIIHHFAIKALLPNLGI